MTPELYRTGRVSRHTTRKGIPRKPATPRDQLLDPDVPVAGFYRTKIRKGAPESVVAIWYGPSRDPETGEPDEDSPYAWQATRNGTPIPVADVWPSCGRDAISKEEHDKICARNRTMDEESPYYDVRKPINYSTVKPPF